MAGASELDKPAVVDDTVHDRGGEPAVREDRAPPAELHVRGEHDAPPLVRVGYGLAGRARAVHVEGDVAEPVEDHEPGPADVRQQPVERPLALGLAEPEHERRGLEEAHRHPATGRLDAEGGGDVRLAAAGGPVEDEVLGAPDEAGREHLVAAPALGEAHVGPVEALHGLGHGEPRLAQQPGALGALARLQLAREHPRARDEPARCRGLEEPRYGRPRYEQRPGARGEPLALGVRDPRHWRHPPPAARMPGRTPRGRPARRARRTRRPRPPWRRRGRRAVRLEEPRIGDAPAVARLAVREPRARAEQPPVVGPRVPDLRDRDEQVAPERADLVPRGPLLVPRAGVGEAVVEPVVSGEPAEERRGPNLGPDPAANLGGVVEDGAQRHAAEELEHVPEPLADAPRGLAPEDLGESGGGARERDRGEVAAGDDAAHAEVRLAEVNLDLAG